MRGSKRIYDSIHGFIHLGGWEMEVVNSPLFQRLHGVRQLGCAYLVYPGAVHSRFEHSLGVMELASKMFDVLVEQGGLKLDERPFWRQMVRLGALMHDLGHLPFSHTAERVLLGPKGHEEGTLSAIRSEVYQGLWKSLAEAFEGRDARAVVEKIAVGEGRGELSPLEKVLSTLVTGDFFGADRIDYLLRDAKYTGLTYGLFDYEQLIERLTIIPETGQVGALEGGLESCEALLLARHFMYRRIYEYPTIKAYGFHLRRVMQWLWKERGVAQPYDLADHDVLVELERAARDQGHPVHGDAAAYYYRKKRVQAIPLKRFEDEEQLIRFKKEKGLSESEMFWELSSHEVEAQGLDFSVMKKGGAVVAASALSSLTIPPTAQGWLYLDSSIKYTI